MTTTTKLDSPKLPKLNSLKLDQSEQSEEN
jgi:hypothetical protein